MSRRHRVTVPRPKPDLKFNLPDLKLPSLYEIRRLEAPRGGIRFFK